LKLIKHCRKGSTTNIWESMFIQAYGHHNLLLAEQSSSDLNPLYNLARIAESQWHNTDTRKPATNPHTTGSCKLNRTTWKASPTFYISQFISMATY
jgi:hypothetical protein